MANNQQQINSSIRINKAAIRAARKLERPKPMKLANENNLKPEPIDHGDELLQKIEYVVKHVNNSNFDNNLAAAIRDMHLHLKSNGIQLETKFKDQLDRYFIVFRNASRDNRLDKLSKLRLLEIIELRASGWRYNENVINYYKIKYQECDGLSEVNNTINYSSSPSTPSTITPINIPSVLLPLNANVPQVQLSSCLTPGEVIKCSGKFAKPTKIPGKNYFKDEIIIRNSDSGKVSQGAKDRLVQITGPGEESINQAKSYIAETIRRNASPVRERPDKERFGSDSSLTSSNDDDVVGHSIVPFRGSIGRKGQQLSHSLSMNDASIGEYQYTVTVGRDTLKISGCQLDLTAKLVLEEYFVSDIEKSIKARKFGIQYSEERKVSERIFFADESNFGSAGDDFVSMQHSPSSPDMRSQMECNGFQSSFLVSSGSEEKENEKCDENSGDSSSPNTPKPIISRRVTVIRDPLFPTSPKEAFEEVENSADMQVLYAKSRRAHFAKQNESLELKSSSIENTEDVDHNKSKIAYSREFLLDCARSPYCRVTPKDMPHIVREVPYLLKKSPDIFDPIAYQIQDFTTHHVNPVLRSSSTVMPEFDEDDLV
uniref:K Homology domain-containing protein n=1 Tax=Strigamia maritima TaxID=126957 RepID=T1J289_STRMM